MCLIKNILYFFISSFLFINIFNKAQSLICTLNLSLNSGLQFNLVLLFVYILFT